MPIFTRYQLLPNCSLLTLCADGDPQGEPLGEALAQALHHGGQYVWVDCRQTPALPTDTVQLLQHYAALLWQDGGYLLLCHLPDALRASLAGAATQPLAAGLLDAHRYGLDCPPC